MLKTRHNLLGEYFFGCIEKVNSVFSAFILEEDRPVVLLHGCTRPTPGKMAVDDYNFLVGWSDDFLELFLTFDSEKNLALGLGWHLF